MCTPLLRCPGQAKYYQCVFVLLCCPGQANHYQWLGLARTLSIQCTYNIFHRSYIKCMVIYGSGQPYQRCIACAKCFQWQSSCSAACCFRQASYYQRCISVSKVLPVAKQLQFTWFRTSQLLPMVYKRVRSASSGKAAAVQPVVSDKPVTTNGV